MDFKTQKLARTYYQCLECAITLVPPHFTTQNQDMCHNTIGSNLVEILVPCKLLMGS